MSSQRRVLVLGGTQFVGPYVVAGLLDRGHDVTIFHSGEHEHPLASHVKHIHGRFEDFGRYLPGLIALEPDVVVDMVPYRAKSGHGVVHFAGVAERAVVLTSGDVYRAFARVVGIEPGPPDAVPLTEDAPLRTKPAPELDSSIDFDNREVELAVESETPSTVILRLPAIFGPGDPFNRFYRFVKRMDDARPAIVLDERAAAWRWSRGYVENVASAVVLAATVDRVPARTYNVGPIETPTEAEWIRLVADVHGWRGSVVAAPQDVLPESMRARFDTSQDVVLDTTRIRDELGYVEPVPLREALARTIAWERAHPPASPPRLDYDAEDAVLARVGS